MTPYTRADWLAHWLKAAGMLALFLLGFAALCALIWAALSRI